MSIAQLQKPFDEGVVRREPNTGRLLSAPVNSGDILRGRHELQINHGGAIYTLRVTRQGKLILTK